MWKSRLFWKLFLVCGVFSGSVAAVFLYTAGQWHRSVLEDQTDVRLLNTASLVISHVERRLNSGDTGTLDALVKNLSDQTAAAGKRAGRQARLRITVVDPEGVVLGDSDRIAADMENHALRPELQQATRDGIGRSERFSDTLGLNMIYLAIPVSDPDDQLAGLVRVAVPSELIDQQVAADRRLLWSLALSIAVFVLPLTFLIVGRTIRPLTQLTETAHAIADGDYTPVVPLRRRDELGDLTRVFREMQLELRRRVEQLQENGQRLETVLSSMVEGVLAVDADQRVLLANTASRRMLEIQQREVVGRPLLEVARNREIQMIVVENLKTGVTREQEITLSVPSRRTLKVRASSLRRDPEPGVVLALHDISDLRKLETMRRDFVANVSHELKTPLASIKGYAETLRLGALNDPNNNLRFVLRIEEEADRLHRLIVDLLQLARVESGKEAFAFVACSLDEVVQRSVSRCDDLARELQIALHVDGPGEEVHVWADVNGVETILGNLLENAIKYSRPGDEVTVRWSVLEEYADIEVEDTGIGIAPADMERVFERFYRVDRARSRELGSTGLGLAIVKHLSQAFGGEVSLSSELDVGSCFRVRLPLASAAVPAGRN